MKRIISIVGLTVALVTGCAASPDATPTSPSTSTADKEFLARADLPPGQERAGITAAREYCNMLDAGGSVKGGGYIFDQHPELQDFNGRALITAAIQSYCPQHTRQLSEL